MAARQWTCRKCRTVHPRRKQLCSCGGRRPPARVPKHRAVLDAPYEEWVAKYGEVCGICGRPPSEDRRLDRDHCHDGDGYARGLLCWFCNKTLPKRVDVEWLEAAAAYLRRAADDHGAR
jgi:hypothetical protein